MIDTPPCDFEMYAIQGSLVSLPILVLGKQDYIDLPYSLMAYLILDIVKQALVRELCIVPVFFRGQLLFAVKTTPL